MHKAERAVENDLGKAEVLASLANLKLTALFMAEASIDLIKILAKVMLNAVIARRALWLRPLVADPASKQEWCRIPFEGHSLFGNKLDTAIAKATGGKSGFIPQDQRLHHKKNTAFRN